LQASFGAWRALQPRHTNPASRQYPSHKVQEKRLFCLLLVDTSTPSCLRVTSLPPARYLVIARCKCTRASYNGVHASSGRRRLPRGDGAAPTLNFRDRIEISDDGTPRHAGARIYPRLPGSRLRPPRVLPQPAARGSPERDRSLPHGKAPFSSTSRVPFSVNSCNLREYEYRYEVQEFRDRVSGQAHCGRVA